MIILLILAFIIIAAIDLPKIIKMKKWKDLIVFSVFFVFAFTVSALLAFGVDLPSPIKGAQYIIKDLLHIKYN